MSNVQALSLQVAGQTLAVESNEGPSDQDREKALVEEAIANAAQLAAGREGTLEEKCNFLANFYKSLNTQVQTSLPDGDPLKAFIAEQNGIFSSPDLLNAIHKLESDRADEQHDWDMARGNCGAASFFATMFTGGLDNAVYAIRAKILEVTVDQDGALVDSLMGNKESESQNSGQAAASASGKLEAGAQNATNTVNGLLDSLTSLSETIDNAMGS